jgi:hypothetical protein
MKQIVILEETFDFIAWKEPDLSFYVRRGNGDLRLMELLGVFPPPSWRRDVSTVDSDPVKISRYSGGELRFRCDFADGTAAWLTGYKSSTPRLFEKFRLENLLQASAYAQKRKPAVKGDKRTSALSAKRAAAGRKHAKVKDPHDCTKIKVAFFRRTNGGISNSAAAREIAELMSADDNPLDLQNGPYYVSADTVERIAKAR